MLVNWTLNYVLSYLASDLLHDPIVKYLTHKDNERDRQPNPQQAEGEDQELQLYSLKVLRDLWGQELCKDIPPILLIYSSLVKHSLIMFLSFQLLTCCITRICMSSSSFHLEILLYIQPL